MEKITLIDKNEIEQRFNELNRFVSCLETARLEFVKVFKTFDIQKFQTFFNSRKPIPLMIEYWVNLEKIDLRGIKLEKAIQMNLLEIPNLTPVIEAMQMVATRLNGLPYFEVRTNFSLLYSERLKKFPSSSEQKTEIFKRIENKNTFTTQNKQEIELIEDVKSFGKTFKKLRACGIVPLNFDLPINLFVLKENGNYEPHPRILKMYRLNKQQ